jgi:hypothetical protein
MRALWGLRGPWLQIGILTIFREIYKQVLYFYIYYILEKNYKKYSFLFAYIRITFVKLSY